MFKWRQGSDSSVVPATNPGSRIDTITLSSTLCGGNAPTVTSAVSRKTHGGAGDFDVPLSLSGSIGIEPRAGAVAGAHTIVVTFANPVTVSGTTLTRGTGSASSVVAGNVVTVNVTGASDVQRLVVTLSGVSDGSNLGNIIIPVGLLQGDVNGNGSVTGSDVSQTKAGAATGTVNGSTFRSDVNAGGSINATDVSIVKSKSGGVLPP